MEDAAHVVFVERTFVVSFLYFRSGIPALLRPTRACYHAVADPLEYRVWLRTDSSSSFLGTEFDCERMIRMSTDYRQWLQDLLNDLGRDDIGVGNVEIGPLLLSFSLHKGRSTFDTSLPLAAFFDRAHVMGRLCGLVVRFNKSLAVQEKPQVRSLLGV